MVSSDDLNRLYTSKSPEDILDFYSFFDSREDLVDWMKKRPDGKATIFEVEGDTDIVVVIPTADYNGKYAKTCREEIFKGLHMVFVQSGGRDDVYFNFGRNANKGIKLALEYNPKWVIISNDDLLLIDDVSVLKENLSRIDPRGIKTVFTNPPGTYHSYRTRLARPNFLRSLFFTVGGKFHRENLRLQRKYGVEYTAGFLENPYKFLFNTVLEFVITGAFSIFSAEYLNELEGNLWDVNYINAVDDFDLSLKVTRNPKDYTFINYRIGDIVGGVLGRNISRTLRNVANLAYLNYKIESGQLQIGREEIVR